MITPDNGMKGKPSRRKVPYEHRQVLNQLLKTIGDSPLEDDLKMILRMRIWGITAQFFRPMTHKEIAIQMRIDNSRLRSQPLESTIKDVHRMEREAMDGISKHLTDHSLLDIIGRFNEKAGNKGDIFKKKNPKSRIIY